MNICPVCGFAMRYPPRDWHICPSCGTEFGYEDVGRTFADLREQWLRSGPTWWSPVDPQPEHWDPIQQMVNGIFLSANPTAPVVSAEVNPSMLTGKYPLPSGSIKRKRSKGKRFFTPTGALGADGTLRAVA
jgi:hypothetical protein